MSSLKLAEFQRAAVETICERLMDSCGSRRFLLADEVGLGKTVVARGVIEELMRPAGAESSSWSISVRIPKSPIRIGRS